LSLEPKISRLFVAIDPPDAVRTRLIALQRELKLVLPRNSTAWTKPEGMHLTLRFLGNVESVRIAELSEQLGAGLAGFGEFDVSCERLGCFPDARHPRVVWAWVHDADERMAQLRGRVDEAVRVFAEKPAEARYVGHITLARPKQITRPDAERLSQFVERAATRRFGAWRVASVALIRSQLSAAGASYAELSRANLR
jgi:RNA 2',3'-cyclic 3'-phosphodiesterase